jgi:lambda family phage portal protein
MRIFDRFRRRPPAGPAAVRARLEGAMAQRRLRGWNPPLENINALVASGGPRLLARSRELVVTNGYAANACEAFAANLVGDGIKPSSLIGDADLRDRVQRLWLAWTDEADADGLTDFYGLQRRAAREVFIAGEVFLRLRPRRPGDGLVVPLQLQMLPSEMVPLGLNRILPGGGSIRQGIEFDTIGRRVAYHVLRRHPGDMTDQGTGAGPRDDTVRVPAADILHVMDPVEAGQLRGVSRFAPAIVKLFTLDLYDDAELERKKTAAMFAMFITSPAPETPLEPAEDDLEVEPGQVVRLDPGEDVSTPATPDSGATYEPFQYRTLLQVGAALGVPYGYLTGDTAKGNFSNTRIALVDFRRRISAVQHSVMVYQLCRTVWARWMDMAVLAGAIDLPGYAQQRRQYQACAWLPTKWDWVDPVKDANAEILQIEAGLKSRTQALSERGYDAEQVDREIATERRREAALGLDFRRPGSPAGAPGALAPGAGGEANNDHAGAQAGGDDMDRDDDRRDEATESEAER